MLSIRPTCEHCNAALPNSSSEARICSFECTFCAKCSDEVLHGICPNCGGGLVARPIRPAQLLDRYPASTEVVFRPVDIAAHQLRLRSMGNSSSTA